MMQEPVLFAETIFYNIAFGLRRGGNEASLAQVSVFYISFTQKRVCNDLYTTIWPKSSWMNWNLMQSQYGLHIFEEFSWVHCSAFHYFLWKTLSCNEILDNFNNIIWDDWWAWELVWFWSGILGHYRLQSVVYLQETDWLKTRNISL